MQALKKCDKSHLRFEQKVRIEWLERVSENGREKSDVEKGHIIPVTIACCAIIGNILFRLISLRSFASSFIYFPFHTLSTTEIPTTADKDSG